MFKKKQTQEIPESISGFGYDILRNDLIPELLGEDEGMILYYSGKYLARKYAEDARMDLPAFFAKCGWGELTLIKEKSKQITYELTTSFPISERSFSLETGFLAQLAELDKNAVSEGSFIIKKKDPSLVEIQVISDLKDPVD
ncbi:DUF2507 domain-containing protein [Salisediminibacterium beveridgei]|uniref:DUF2507 domain-containing protein n=1 Tax=Salisediminibacterium beveridgei TaxID=632773 RepID=A0A1D7QTF8_9BACI|nr:DUF2507 domain-containing protein [Salisediminibacterium beveridgei]AOM82312.1 hypothetical protein BBEV_0942 [Salisediminibacterium beveridgei]